MARRQKEIVPNKYSATQKNHGDMGRPPKFQMNQVKLINSPDPKQIRIQTAENSDSIIPFDPNQMNLRNNCNNDNKHNNEGRLRKNRMRSSSKSKFLGRLFNKSSQRNQSLQ